MREPDIETEITLRSTEAGGQETPETRPREAASDSPGLDAGVSAISLDFAHRDPALKARLSRIYAAHRTLLLSIGGTSNMKAIVYYQYGSPDVLRLMEVDKPSVSDGGVLVRVRGAAANPYDWHFVRGEPYFMRLLFGLRAPKRNSLGVDFSGVVEAVAQGVTAFKLGDEVYGMCDSAFAEYLCAPETEIAQKPRTLGFDLAAAVPLAGLTALRGLRDCGQLRRGDRVLIIGASGGVGTFAVQLAKDFGGHVTGVCSMKNLEMVRRSAQTRSSTTRSRTSQRPGRSTT